MSLRKELQSRTARKISCLLSATLMLFTLNTECRDVLFYQGDPQYQASYNLDQAPNPAELHMQLELLNFDVTSWFQYN